MAAALSRRDAMIGSAALFPAAARGAETAPRRLIAGTRTLDVNGRAATVFRLEQPSGRSGVTLAPGERFRVALENQAGTATIVHWHGQVPPWMQDGFPWPQTPPLPPGAAKAYDYAPIPGTFWMHSHAGLQEQRLMAAPLIVHATEALREDRQDIVIMLHDFSFRAPDELLAGLTGQTPAAIDAMMRETESVPAPPANAVPTVGGTMPGMMHMSAMAMDLNDIAYDAFLANDRTLAAPQVVRVARSGRVRLRIINGASSSQFWIDLGAISGRVVAVDGHAVHPVAGTRFPIAIAQRLDILLDLPSSGTFPILARLEGSRRQTGIVLATPGAAIGRVSETASEETKPVDNSLEQRLVARSPLAPRQPDLVHRIVLTGGMKPYAWALNGAYWPRITPLMLTEGQRVEIELVNHSMMPHPMHLHGHSFQVIAVNGKTIAGAMRDTVLVTPMMGSVRIAFDAGNPGRWAFHCHNLYHMAAGMLTEFRYRGIPA